MSKWERNRRAQYAGNQIVTTVITVKQWLLDAHSGCIGSTKYVNINIHFYMFVIGH